MAQLKELIVYIAPFVAGFITSILIPLLIKRQTMRRLEKRIEQIKPDATTQNILNKLNAIEKELLELRGKRK